MERMQSFVDAAGAAIGYGGNPFETPVGAKIEAATDDSLVFENWALFMEICDMINTLEDGPRDAVKAIRRKLQNSAGKSNTSTLFTLTVLETCAKNCRKPFHLLVCQKDFVDILINKVISPKVEPPLIIQEKVLSIIQSWAHAFSPDPDLRGVAEIYMELKRKGVEFPPPSDDDLLLVESNQSSPSSRPSSSASSHTASSHSGPTKSQSVMQIPAHAPVPSKHTDSKPAIVAEKVGTRVAERVAERVASGRKMQSPKIAASGTLTEGQVRKLQRDLELTQRNMDVFSELLTELQLGENHPEDKKLVVQVSETCGEMQTRILELVATVQHRTLTAQLLEINDNMNNLFLRYERYQNNTETKFISKEAEAAGVVSPSSVHLEVAIGSTPNRSRPASNDMAAISNPADFEEMEAWMKEHEKDGDTAAAPRDSREGMTSKEFDKFLEQRAKAMEEST